MAKISFYEYQNCSTCKKAKKFLEKKKLSFDIIPIREKPPKKKELKQMLSIYEGNIKKLFNVSGMDYRSMNLKEKLPTLSEKEALDLLSSNGNLVKRPFMIVGDRGIVGFKEDEWKKLLK